jgi:hypothetical protein
LMMVDKEENITTQSDFEIKVMGRISDGSNAAERVDMIRRGAVRECGTDGLGGEIGWV